MGELRWPSPHDYPPPLPLEARLSWRKALALAGGFLLASPLWGLLGKYTTPRGAGTGIMLAILFAGVGLVALWRAHRLRRREYSCPPAVEMHPQGIIIPELFERTVPWSEVTQVNYDPPSISITVRDEARFHPTRARLVEVAACGPIPAPLPECLDVWPRKLHDAIQAHRAHFGNGGQSG